MRAFAAALCLATVAVLPPADAAAQLPPPGPPGPFVVDLRGATAGIPQSTEFFPPLGAATLVPARAFGFAVGAHVYLFRLGAARLGVGVELARLRGTADAVVPTSGSSTGTSGTTTVTTADTISRVEVDTSLLAPQVSFNFGSENGWSYLSGGLGTFSMESRTKAAAIATRDSGRLSAINAGGGVRWFVTPHFGVGFDIRMHRAGAGSASGGRPGTPSTTSVTAAVGVSVK